MNVSFVDLTREYEQIESEIDGALEDVLHSGRFIQGDHVEAFEEEFAAFVDTEYGVGVNSGSDALTLALRALGVGPGDEVITVSHTFVSTANAAVKNNARPVFVDVDPKTLCMDVDALEDAVTEETAAIVPVHLYGQPVEMEPIVELAEEYGLAVVEDASQAHGATYDGKPVGSFGDVGCFSLYPTKNLGAYGDAGVLVTDDVDVAAELRSLRDYGRTDKYQYERVENHSRLDEMQAAILREKLRYLDEWNARRRTAASEYRDLLADTRAEPLGIQEGVEHVYHLFVVRHPDRDGLRRHLEANGIDAIIHYPIPVHEQPAYADHESRHDLAVTERATDQILSLPIHPWITNEELEAVTAAVQAFDEA